MKHNIVNNSCVSKVNLAENNGTLTVGGNKKRKVYTNKTSSRNHFLKLTKPQKHKNNKHHRG